MNRRDLHFVRSEYEPGTICDCKRNAYEWRFCERHLIVENERHTLALAQHRPLDWLSE